MKRHLTALVALSAVLLLPSSTPAMAFSEPIDPGGLVIPSPRDPRPPREAPQPSRSIEREPVLDSGLDWKALRWCESRGQYDIISSNGLWYGAYQFTISTWQAVGGSGLPSDASPAEQDMRAQRLYDTAGASPWPNCRSLL